MLLCKNCNKEYNQSLKFCPTCGSELIAKVESETVNMTCVSSENLKAQEDSTKVENYVDDSVKEKKCESCGSTIVDSAKFCIKCGNPLNTEETHANSEDVQPREVKHSFSWEERLQEDLTGVFRSNKFFDFFWKYATIFALYYPIYLVISRIEAFSGLVESLDYISTLAFYTYCIGLVALFSKRNYLNMILAVGIRLLNSFIRLFQTAVPVSSICRIIVLVPVLVFLIKKFRTTGQYRDFKNCYNTRRCPICEASVKENDKFCPKCGRNIEGRIL